MAKFVKIKGYIINTDNISYIELEDYESRCVRGGILIWFTGGIELMLNREEAEEFFIQIKA